MWSKETLWISVLMKPESHRASSGPGKASPQGEVPCSCPPPRAPGRSVGKPKFGVSHGTGEHYCELWFSKGLLVCVGVKPHIKIWFLWNLIFLNATHFHWIVLNAVLVPFKIISIYLCCKNSKNYNPECILKRKNAIINKDLQQQQNQLASPSNNCVKTDTLTQGTSRVLCDLS